MNRDFTEVLGNASFLEGSRWHDGRLWVSDCYTQRVLSVNEDGHGQRVEALVPGNPSGLGFLPDGRLLAVSMKDQLIVRRESDGNMVVHADLSGSAKFMINDMVVDPYGRCWVGCLGFDIAAGAPVEAAVLVRVDPDGATSVVADDVWVPNGTVFHDETIVLAETFANRMTAFDVDAAGVLTNRRAWAEFGSLPESRDVVGIISQLEITPDGIAEPDAEGAIWIADAFHARALRIAPGGQVLEEIRMPDGLVFDVSLGGADGHTLFLAVSPGYAEAERRDRRDSVLLATRVDVPLARTPAGV